MLQHQNTIKPNETPILFVNFSDEPYDIVWDGQSQANLKPKETRWLPYWLAEHAAKHLVDREMNKIKMATDHHSRESFIAKCIGNKPDTGKNDDPLGLKTLNRNMEEQATPKAKKGGRPKKESVSDEDSFEGK